MPRDRIDHRRSSKPALNRIVLVHSRLSVFVAFLLGLGSLTALLADQAQLTRPLDLPAGGTALDEDDEDIIEPQSILFYGQYFEGDAFVWVLDKSCSMGGARLAELKLEVISAVAQLSRDSEFGVLAFSENALEWRRHIVRADAITKGSCFSWVQKLEAGGGTKVAPAIVRGLQVLYESDREARRLIVVSDGEPDHAVAALISARAANYEDVPIDTILVSDTGSGLAFMQALAAQNDGQHRWVTP